VSLQEQVTEFHEVFGVAIGAPWTPELIELRIALLQEELQELVVALRSGDPVAVAQESADLGYVLYGTTISLGIDLGAAVTEVHAANMSKLGADGRPIRRADGKILKGPNYRPPNMTAVVGGTGWQWDQRLDCYRFDDGTCTVMRTREELDAEAGPLAETPREAPGVASGEAAQ
jgi:predicted HAD superfamily Cof-like phosphohydrolase